MWLSKHSILRKHFHFLAKIQIKVGNTDCCYSFWMTNFLHSSSSSSANFFHCIPLPISLLPLSFFASFAWLFNWFSKCLVVSFGKKDKKIYCEFWIKNDWQRFELVLIWKQLITKLNNKWLNWEWSEIHLTNQMVLFSF